MDDVYVLDSFAFLAHLKGEEKSKQVADILTKAKSGKISLYMPLTNLGEVYYIVIRERGAVVADEIMLLVEQLPIKIITPDREMVFEAAKLKAKYPVAFADCFACALALKKNAKIITGDPEFKKLTKMSTSFGYKNVSEIFLLLKHKTYFEIILLKLKLLTLNLDERRD